MEGWPPEEFADPQADRSSDAFVPLEREEIVGEAVHVMYFNFKPAPFPSP